MNANATGDYIYTMPRNHLSISEARRVVIKSQGLHQPSSTSKRLVTAHKIGAIVGN